MTDAGYRPVATKRQSKVRFFGMIARHHARALVLAPFAVSALAASGCVSSPTYGTDKTSAEQLVGDLSGAFSLKPKENPHIDYRPRPALVKPASGGQEALPAPQEDITQVASNQWPESPEQRRARLRKYATEHADDPNYQPQIINDISSGSTKPAKRQTSYRERDLGPDTSSAIGSEARRAEINRRLAEGKQGSATERKYLSEPPLTYRVPASTAPQGDIGEDEYKKQRRLKREAEGKGSGWFDWW
ncbi:hypothetical protein BFN67_02965 [Pseudaminobacter manganicus]|uniref:Lipoprotein n=2 Tax=Manganibacter manganicus TaxID=1873176 RepID=A0A1V8RRN8_9HYPH|nr:hypothetical protein BFN67_02965 [Pseudaminobacter manganicus]